MKIFVKPYAKQLTSVCVKLELQFPIESFSNLEVDEFLKSCAEQCFVPFSVGLNLLRFLGGIVLTISKRNET